jgi:uncharacterized membrane protein (DUF2068 family)
MTDKGGRKPGSDAAGVKVVVIYKIVKSAVELLIGCAFLALGSAGLPGEFAKLARAVRRHAAPAWGIALAERLADASTSHHVYVVAMAMIFDGILTGVEGWALYRGFAWGQWLVIGTTSSLLPWEGVTLIRHPSIGRSAILVVNVLIVAYLVRSRIRGVEKSVAP